MKDYLLMRGKYVDLEKIIDKLLTSQFFIEKDIFSIEIKSDHQRIASRLLEVKLFINNSTSVTVFVKMLNGNKQSKSFLKNQKLIQKEYDLLNRIYAETLDLSNISVVKPLAVFPEDLTLVTLSAGDLTALDVFKKSMCRWGGARELSRSVTIAENCGQFLMRLQSMTLGRNEVISKENISKRLLDSIDRILPENNTLYKKIHASIQLFMKNKLSGSDTELGDLNTNIVISRCHGDYTPQNVIVQGEKIFVLDFCDSNIQSIYFDIARFYQVLDYYNFDPRFSSKKINKIKTAFLKEFGPLNENILTIFRLEILIQGIKERIRMRELYVNRNNIGWLLNEWYLRKRIYNLCLICDSSG